MDQRRAFSVHQVEVSTPLARSQLVVQQSDTQWSVLREECRDQKPDIVDGGIGDAPRQLCGKVQREVFGKHGSQTVTALADTACPCEAAAEKTSAAHNNDSSPGDCGFQPSRPATGVISEHTLPMRRCRPPTLDSVHTASMTWEDQSLMECCSSHPSHVSFNTRRPCLPANITQHPQQLAGDTFTRTAPGHTWEPLAITSSEKTSSQPAGAGDSERTLAPFIQSWGDSVSQSAGGFLPPATAAQLSEGSVCAETASFAWDEMPTNRSQSRQVAQDVSAAWRKAVLELPAHADDDKASSLCTSSMTILAPNLSLPVGLEDASSVIETDVLGGSIVAADMFAEHDCCHLKHGDSTPSTVPSCPAAPETCSPHSPISSCSNPYFSVSSHLDTHALCSKPQNEPSHFRHVTEVCDIGQLQAEASALQAKALNLQAWINSLAHERCARQNASCNCHSEPVGGA